MRWAGNPHSWGNFAGAWASGRSSLYFSQSRIRGDEGPSKLNGALPTDRRLTCRVVKPSRVVATAEAELLWLSGRFAMIDDRRCFQLVSWRPALEQHLGRHLSRVTCPPGP